MKLSVIIPVYNERKTIEEVVKNIIAIDLSKFNLTKEIVIVDDGSIDGTREVLDKISKDKSDSQCQIKVISNQKNQGKGASIRTALNYSNGEIIIIQDADLEYSPEDYPELVEPIISGKVDVVYGSRILGKGKMSYLSFYVGGRLLSFLTNILYFSHITDEPTCYKVFRSTVFKNINLKCERFEFCPEVTAKVLKKGYKIYEVPIHYHPRSISEGKKIKWKDGFQAIWTLIKYRFFD